MNGVAGGAALRGQPRMTLTTGPACVDTMDQDPRHVCLGSGCRAAGQSGHHFETPYLLGPIESGGFQNPTKEPLSSCGGLGCRLHEHYLAPGPVCPVALRTPASSGQEPLCPPGASGARRAPLWLASSLSWQPVEQLHSDSSSEHQDQSPTASLLSTVTLGRSLSVPKSLQGLL